MDALGSHGLKVDAASFDFNLTKTDINFCENFFKEKGIQPQDRLIGVLPLAAWLLKSWPIKKWNKLAEILKNQYKMKVLCLAKVPNNDLGRRIIKEISPEIISAGTTTLSQAKALVKHCRIFIGPDSSLLHLASCMGVEAIGLYGPTPSNHFYPYFHRQNIILPEKKLPCMPCLGKKPVCAKAR